MDLVNLIFKANTSELDKAQSKLDSTEKSTQKLQSSLHEAGTAGKSGGAAIASGASVASTAVTALKTQLALILAPLMAIQTVISFVKLGAEAEQLGMRLQTATGSAENAALAMKALQDFAKTTPFSLNEVAGSFQKLVNLGLEPSERALRSYGNTASAMGRSMDQMIEAVADASTGEFERLKEFGITSKKQGDQVSFTFQGVTTQIKNNSKDIEEYLMRLGETKFGTAMDNQAQTMAGAFSNMMDNISGIITKFFQQSKIGDFIKEQMQTANKWLEGLLNWFEQGGFEKSIANWKIIWQDWVDLFGPSLQWVFEKIVQLYTAVREKLIVIFGALFQTVALFPSFVREAFGKGSAYIESFISKMTAYGQAIAEFVTNPGGYATTAANLQGRLTAIDKAFKDHVTSLEAQSKRSKDAVSSILNPGGVPDAPKASGDRLAAFRIPGTGKGGAADNKNGKGPDEKSKLLTPEQISKLQQAGIEALKKESEEYYEWLAKEDEKKAQSIEKANEKLRQQKEDLENLLDPSKRHREQIEAILANPLISDEMKERAVQVYQQLADNALPKIKQVAEANKELTTEGKFVMQVFGDVSTALTNAFTTGDFSFKKFLSSFLKGIAQMILQLTILKPMMSALTASFSTGGGGFGSVFANIGKAFAGEKFASGGVFTNGIVTKPTMFNAAQMGEAGPEAIMPLKRTANGSLGVQVTGGASQGVVFSPVTHITVQGGESNEQTAQAVSKAMEARMRSMFNELTAANQRRMTYAV